MTYRDPYGLSPDSVKFTGEQAREYWTQLKESAGRAMRSGDAGQRILGSLLSGMMASMESVSATEGPMWREAKGAVSRAMIVPQPMCFW